MDLQIQTKRKLFVACPFDVYIRSMYEDIYPLLFNDWDIKSGPNVWKEDKESAELEEFIHRNKALFSIFVKAINECEFFIADVTGAKANVMLELGIAIQLNKNILIVTSEDFRNLPFDISEFAAKKYTDKKQLIEIIKREISLYKKIKDQTFAKSYDGFHFPFPSEGLLKHGEQLPLKLPKNLKNLKLKLKYKFENVSKDIDWFGVHLRALTSGFITSELVYVRQNGLLETDHFPGVSPIIGDQIPNNHVVSSNDFGEIVVLIEENLLLAQTSNRQLKVDSLLRENFGQVILQAWAHDNTKEGDLLVRYKDIEIISLDTISLL